MKFLTLLEIEFKKIAPILAVLLGGGTLVVSGLIFNSINQFNKELMLNNMGIPIEEIVKTSGKVTLAQILDENMVIFFVIMLIGILTIFSGFYLWYKEWFGYSKRIYMLLTLKGSRFTILLSKLCVVVVSVFLYYGFVLTTLGIASLLMKFILPHDLVADGLIRGSFIQSYYINFVIPLTPSEFIYEFLFVVMMFSILSAFVMLDRSKRVWGLLGGIVYGLTTVIIFFYTQALFLYSDERVIVNYAFVMITTIISTILSAYLLKRKVSI